jgi:uncharacterized membrane protein
MVPLREMADTWASLYSNSAALRSTLSFAHMGGLITGGGCAIAADLGALRAFGRGPEHLRHELERFHAAHRIVISSLAIVIVSGLLLMFADLDAYLESTAFWIKMGLVVALMMNGGAMVWTSERAEAGDSAAIARLRFVSLASMALWLATTILGAVLPNVL